MGKSVFEPKILAVARCVLTNKVNFPDALGEQARSFGNDRFKPAASKFPAVLGDDAKGTGVVASFGDFNVREMTRGGKDARRQIVIEISARWVRFAIFGSFT